MAPELLKSLINKEIIYLRNLSCYARTSTNYGDIPEFPIYLYQIIPVFVSFLYQHIDFFNSLEHDIATISGTFRLRSHTVREAADEVSIAENHVQSLVDIMRYRGILCPIYSYTGKIQDVIRFIHKDNVGEFFVPGYDVASRTNIFIPRGLQNEEWAKPYILWYAFHEKLIARGFTENEILEIEVFFRGIFTVQDVDSIAPLEIALWMVRAGAAKLGIKAGIISAGGRPAHVPPDIKQL